MIKEIALRKLASIWEDDLEDSLDKSLKNVDFTDNAAEIGALVGGYKLSKKYGTNFGKWGDRHIKAILDDPKSSNLAKWYANKLPKNRWARATGALISNSIYPALLAYGGGSILNKLKGSDKDV